MIDWIIPNKNMDENFSLEFNFTPFKAMSFSDASIYTANVIANKYDNLAVALSGGIDSEYVLKVFLEAKIPVRPVILLSGLTKLEIQYAFMFCKKHNLKYDVIPISIRDHITETLIGLRDTKGNIINNYVQFMVAKRVPQYKIVTGNGEPFASSMNLYVHDNILDSPKLSDLMVDDLTELELNDSDFYMQPEHPGSFFLHTQEIYYAMLKEFDYSLSLPEAKAKLYGLDFRAKIAISDVYTQMATKLPKYPRECVYKFNKDDLIRKMENYVL